MTGCRAQVFAQIFNGAGPGWREYVPDDAQIRGDTVIMDGIRMNRIPVGWLLIDRNHTTVLVRPKVPEPVPAQPRVSTTTSEGVRT